MSLCQSKRTFEWEQESMVVSTVAERILLINKMYRDVGINREQVYFFAVATACVIDLSFPRLTFSESNS